MKGLLKMKNVIKTFVIAILSILATIIVCNINMTTTAHAETYDIEQAYELVNKEMKLYASCYDENDGTFNVDYDTACEIAQLEAEYYATSAEEEQTTTTTTAIEEQTTTTTAIEEQTTTTTTVLQTTTTTTEGEQTTTEETTEAEEQTTIVEEKQNYIPCNQCKEEAYEYVNQTAQIYNSVFDGTNFNVDYDTACKLVELEFEYYSTLHEHTTAEEPATSETNLNSAYEYVNQEAEIYSSCYDENDGTFNVDYDTACEIVQLQMEYYSK